MKFYGNGIVWDGDNNKVLCKFLNGEIETSDKHIIDKLTEKGYKCDVVKEAIAVTPTSAKTAQVKKAVKK